MDRLFVLHRKDAGFSLLEVLIAVVVLSVGLLALAALQGALTRSSADAKMRGRVAAMLTTHMDSLRNGGYGNLTVGTTTFDVVDACDGDSTDWLDCAREQAGLPTLDVEQVITVWFGAGSFASSNAEQDPALPQFKRIVLTSTWTDTGGVDHSQSITSDVSSMSLTNNIVVPPDPLATPTGGPIVRTISPATAGVIPIAISNDSNAATTNPMPELVGQQNNQQIVGTRFSVLNYASSFGSSVVIQKRFDNEVVKCRCQYGAGGVNLPEIYRTALWPAIWTGEGYEVADVSGTAPGQTHASGPRAGVQQSALCQECCRDHHDNDLNAEVRFDPERTGSLAKHNPDANGVLVPVVDMQAGEYVDSCRLIRVDGFWRTASDAYERNHSLLETQPQGSVEAKSGLPTTAAVDAYDDFVRQYLRAYTGADAFYPEGTFGHNAGEINIAAVSNTDYRYLHVRGLYVDYLEEEALEKLAEVRADTDDQGQCPTDTPNEECVMPYLPFTTVNLTEIANWLEVPADPPADPPGTAPGYITVNERNLLSNTPAQPSGGRTVGVAEGSSFAESSIRRSSSGIAVSSVLTDIDGVDTDDDGDILYDRQEFQVGPGNGPAFNVLVTGGGGNPFVFFTLGTDVGIECLKPSGPQHRCVASEGAVLGGSGAVIVSNYWRETTQSIRVTTTCNGQGATETIAVPIFSNYRVDTALVNGVPATLIDAPVNDIKITESTTIQFASIAQGALVEITLVEEAGSPIQATIASCTTNGGGNKINNIVWNKPWTQP